MDNSHDRSDRASTDNRRPSSVNPKSEIIINVYDLLPPGKLSNTLWFLGSSLLHTGMVVKSLNREYAFGGHDRPGLSGVYWTRPKSEPPGGTWRCEILHGFTFRSEDEIEAIVKDASQQFLGTSYNLLTNNCNHFTSFLCQKLTGRLAPSWLNRAASIGIALPCVVPREWIAPPDHDTADGELLEGEEDDERTSMLRIDYERARESFHGSHGGRTDNEQDEWERAGDSGAANKKGKNVPRDSEGRPLPSAERAPYH